MPALHYRKTIVRWVKGKEVREEVECVDYEHPQEGLTPEEIEADRADMNIEQFCRMLGVTAREQAAQKVEAE
jgi:hypothetical protein